MIDLYSASSNLGDNLSFTPLMRAAPCRLHLYNDDAVRSIGSLFDGMAEVIYDNAAPIASPEAAIAGPHSLKLLYQFGHPFANAIPSIKLTADEIEWARAFTADMVNPCIIKASTQKPNYRTPPVEIMQSIIDSNPGTTFLMSGLSSNHPKNNFVNVPLKGAYMLWDYPVRKLAAIYHAVGHYIGPDTGDYHLMLAVGGKTDVLVPRSNSEYPHIHFHYSPICWVGEKVRARYHHWDLPLTNLITNLKS